MSIGTVFYSTYLKSRGISRRLNSSPTLVLYRITLLRPATSYFSSPIFRIPGRMFPVTALYALEPESDYLEAALLTVLQVR